MDQERVVNNKRILSHGGQKPPWMRKLDDGAIKRLEALRERD